MSADGRDNLPEPIRESDGLPLPSARGEILLYQTADGRTRVECRFEDKTIWLSQTLMAELYKKDVRTINEHLKNIYAEGELEPAATIRNFRIVRREGGRAVSRQIAEAVGRKDATLTKLMDGYYWVTITEKCLPPLPDEFAKWKRWLR